MKGSPLRSALARRPWPLLFLTAIAGLVASTKLAPEATLAALCGDASRRTTISGPVLETALLSLALTSPAQVLTGWSVMLVAMMPPLLAMPLVHVWRSSLQKRRLAAAAAFVLAYGWTWMVAGPFVILIGFSLRLLAGPAALPLALLGAVLWSASPWHRMALNRGHRLDRIGAFGWRATLDCLSFGVRHAGACIASCWAWMVVPLTSGEWHTATMFLAGVLIMIDRLSPAGRPRWRIPTCVTSVASRARLRFANHG